MERRVTDLMSEVCGMLSRLLLFRLVLRLDLRGIHRCFTRLGMLLVCRRLM